MPEPCMSGKCHDSHDHSLYKCIPCGCGLKFETDREALMRKITELQEQQFAERGFAYNYEKETVN